MKLVKVSSSIHRIILDIQNKFSNYNIVRHLTMLVMYKYKKEGEKIQSR